jgi:hypothetical protein
MVGVGILCFALAATRFWPRQHAASGSPPDPGVAARSERSRADYRKLAAAIPPRKIGEF